jgi:thioredoxin-like negative regulator of GroEL
MPPRKKVVVEETPADAISIKKFYAPWCKACTALNDEMDKVKQKKSNLMIEEINTDDDPNLATFFGVKALPTLIYVHEDGTNDVLEAPGTADVILRWLGRVSA